MPNEGGVVATQGQIIGTLKEFDPKINSWEVHKRQLKQFFNINNITKDDKRRALLLHSLNEFAFKLLSDLCVPEIAENKSFESLTQLLDDYFSTKKSVWGERYHFYAAKQEKDESLVNWSARVRHLATYCNFNENLPIVLRDKFVFGLANTSLLEKVF